MRAKFIYEKFTEEDSDPIIDMNIGYVKHLREINKVLQDSDIRWVETLVEEKELLIQLDAEEYHHETYDIPFSTGYSKDWDKFDVTAPFIEKYYINVDLNINIVKRTRIITNSDIIDFEYNDQKILSKNPCNMSPKEIVEIIEIDWINCDTEEVGKLATEAIQKQRQDEYEG